MQLKTFKATHSTAVTGMLLTQQSLSYRQLDGLGFDPQQGQKILLFLKMSGPSLQTTKPLLQWKGAHSRGYSVQVVKLTTHLHLLLSS
jgi:hypothetical protein